MMTDRLINLLAAITVVQMMVTIGLGAAPGGVMAVARDGRTVARALAANYLVVPAVAVGLLLAFRPEPRVAAGFLIAAVCPGAPYAPPFTALARGNALLSVGLMVLLAASSAILAPVLLGLLLPLVAGDRPLTLNAGRILSTLLLVQLLPLAVGLGLRGWHPGLAARMLRPCSAVSKGLNLLLIAGVLSVQFAVLRDIRPAGYAGMLALIGASLAAGWLAGGSDPATRRTLAITTGVRNAGVSLVIAGASFAGTPAVAAATAFALVQTLLIALAAFAWGRAASLQTIPMANPR